MNNKQRWELTKNTAVKKAANTIINSKAVKVTCYQIHDNEFGFERCSNVIQLDNGLNIEFNPDSSLRSGYRFYSPISRYAGLADSEYIRDEFPDEFNGKENFIEQALKDWAWNWKAKNAFHDDGFLCGSGNTRKRRVKHLKYVCSSSIEETNDIMDIVIND